MNDISPDILKAKQRYSIIGNASALVNAVGRAIQVAPIDLSVLIIGESGTGKEFFPNIIHDYSSRKHNRYIAVNCGAIPEGTIDSELFGHEKGAFTGAISSRKGYFEEADGGTIFLDEVAELPLTTQARLLRVLESGEYIKVGSSVVQKTNIRVVAATNKDMLQAVSEGKFREDLYYRLSTILIQVPPLRARGNDILLLTRKFAGDFAEKYRMPSVKLLDDAKDALLSYRWPGNVRQLKNIVEQMSLFEAGNTVDAEQVKKYLPQYGGEYKPAVASASSFSYNQERELLFKMLFKMQNDIDELRTQLEHERQHSDVSHHIENSGKELAVRHSHSLMRYPSAYDKTSATNEVEYSEVTGEDREEVPVEHTSTGKGQEKRQPMMTLEDTERETIRRSLERNGGKRRRAAEELNISERTLYRKIKEYGLE
ncbi:MAG: sigma-54-dependent Fis family transcriptional regulator [Muribaculaceae bacterium]|nr:sigma-54-dependent Fis family transcriptional regulator [Muribaculaceae bacterium]